jgi:solute carrier family 25 protein 14/30
VKIRFQSCTPKRPNPYRHTFHAFAAIFRAERGLLGLYRGVGPTTVRASILTASQLASYDHTKRCAAGRGGARRAASRSHPRARTRAGGFCGQTTSTTGRTRTSRRPS